MRKPLFGIALIALAGCRPTPRPPSAPEPVRPIETESPTPALREARRAFLDEPTPTPTPPEPVVVKPARDVRAVIVETNAALVDAYFPYDRSELTDQALAALRRDAALVAALLREFSQLEVVVEGHCDERGSAAYNLGLGARRAERAAGALATFGVAPERMRTISYGNERPQCEVSAESCWRLNRRAHLELGLRQPASATGAAW